MKRFLMALVLAGCGTTGGGGGGMSVQPVPFELHSTAFADGQPLPKDLSCEGSQAAPALSWTGVPAGTVSLALTVLDPDATSNPPFGHWVAFNIPPVATPLANGAALPAGAVQATNDRGGLGWAGPCPPPGSGNHHYVFTLYALDTTLALGTGVKKGDVQAAMQGHILGYATLVGRYQR